MDAVNLQGIWLNFPGGAPNLVVSNICITDVPRSPSVTGSASSPSVTGGLGTISVTGDMERC